MKSANEFDKFSDLTKRLLSVPKTEIDKRHKEWQQQKDRKHKPKKASGRGVSRDSGGGT
jgi:DnaJ-domain-containing protein 1